MAAGDKAPAYEASIIVMGTIGRVQIWGLDDKRAHDLAEQAFTLWKQIDQRMSLYKPSSELVRLNENAGKRPVEISDQMVEILSMSAQYTSQTRGIFDVRVGALMDAWGLGVVSRQNLPGKKEILQTQQRMCRAKILLYPKKKQALITESGVKLDLGGIAKGFALDKACELMRGAGASRAILDLGGQLMVFHPPAEGWKIGIREPGQSEKIIGTLTVRHTCSISTSSQQDRFVKKGKKRFGHVLDPRSGYPVQRDGAVTIVARSATQADVLSKVFLIASQAEMKDMLSAFPDTQILSVMPESPGTSWRIWQTPGMETMLLPQRNKSVGALKGGMVRCVARG